MVRFERNKEWTDWLVLRAKIIAPQKNSLALYVSGKVLGQSKVSRSEFIDRM